MAKSYWEKLKDPRWQRRRLEIMERDEFSCANCGADDKTLNVHHKFYLRGKAPWEYSEDWLETLCEDCHASIGSAIERFFYVLVESMTESHEYLTGFCLGRQMIEALNGGPPCREIQLESDLEIRGALSAWTQGRLPRDFSVTESGETLIHYIISKHGVVRIDDPEILPGLQRVQLCY